MISITSQIGLYAFLVLLPLIILYLIKPKPKDIVIPSLMFFSKEKGESKRKVFFRKFLRNLLFIIQLLVLASLAFNYAEPYIVLPFNVSIGDTVVVLDSSASSSVLFNRMVEMAKDDLSGDISIVLAENIPVSALEKSSKTRAIKTLSQLKPRDTKTNLGDAIVQAADILGDIKGRIVVYSDFNYNDGPNPLVAKRAVEAKGISVRFVPVGQKIWNNGITELKPGKYNSKVYVKNFNDKPVDALLKLTNNGESIKQVKLTIMPESVETYMFETLPGVTRIELSPQDGFMKDNVAYLSAPKIDKIRVLLITNSKHSNVKSALKASKDIELSVAVPPIFPDFDHDITIIDNVSKSLFLPGTIKEIGENVKKGNSLVIAVQEDSLQFDYTDILPVTLDGVANRTELRTKLTTMFTKDIKFGSVAGHLDTELKEGATSFIVSDADKPVIAIGNYEAGNVVYYGILPKKSSFENKPSYPIFWDRLASFLVGAEDIAEFNYPSGKILNLEFEQEVQTPSERIKAAHVFLDEAGIYSVGNKDIAVNLLSEEESDIKLNSKLLEEDQKSFAFAKGKGKALSMERFLLMFASILILLEIIYVKVRGDL